jgi:transposase
MAKRYSNKFKTEMVQKALSPGGLSAKSLSINSGVSQTAISRWVREYGKSRSMNKQTKIKHYSPEEKLQALIETAKMDEYEFGEYLRKNGLYSSTLEQWKEECLSGIKSPGRPKKDAELQRLDMENKELKRDVHRKDKALAEMSARIVLLKKSHLIWGDGEDGE